MKKRALAAVLFLMMVLTLLPAAALAADTDRAIQIGPDVLKTNHNTKNAASVYFGKDHKGSPCAWRVVGYDKHGVAGEEGLATLFSTHCLGSTIYERVWQHEDWTYAKSDLRHSVDALANKLTEKEKTVVVPRTLVSGTFIGRDTDCIREPEVKNALYWPLSIKEALATDNAVLLTSGDFWWLRSPFWVRGTGEWPCVVVGRKIDIKPMILTSHCPVRPAFHLKPDTVLLASAAAGGKASGEAGENAMRPVADNSKNTWKLTLLDDEHSGFRIVDAQWASHKLSVEIDYTGAKTGENEFISALIKDASGSVTHYGRIQSSRTSSTKVGRIQIDLSGLAIDETDTLYIFNEQYNGDKRTDYASPLREVDIPPLYSAELIPANMSFYTQPEGYADYPPQKITITNTGSQELSELSVSLDSTGSDGFLLDTSGMMTPLAAGSSTTFTVKPKHGLTEGVYSATLRISAKHLTTIEKPLSFEVDNSTVAIPVFSPNGGGFGDFVEVEISCATSDARIYYTLDGRVPDESCALYSVPFTLRESFTVRAIAFKTGMKRSAETSAAFTKSIPTYSVTVQAEGGGTASASLAKATAGTKITLSAEPDGGRRFKEWQVLSGGVAITENSFIMPAADVTIKAVFESDTPSPIPPIPPTPTPVPGGGGTGGDAGNYAAPAQNTAQNAKRDIWISGVNIPSEDALITTPAQNGTFLKLLGGNKLIGVWDISLKSGRTAIPGSTLSFHVGKKNAGKVYTLYHQKAGSTVESFSAKADAQGIVSFYPINELSPFMLTEGGGISTTSIVSVPATGGMSIGPALLLSAAWMAAMLIKRRKEQA